MKTLSVNNFAKIIAAEEPHPLYVVHGEQTFFHDQFINSVEKRIFTSRSEKDLNHHVLYGTENTLAEMISACMAYPMLASHKLVIVRQFNSMKIDDKEALEKYINNPQSTTALVLSAISFGSNKLEKAILEKSVSLQCKRMYEREIYPWVSGRFEENDISVDRDALVFLVENIGLDLLRLNLEVDKICNYVGSGAKLGTEEIAQITGFSREVNIFNFQKILAEKDLKRSLFIATHLLEQGESLAGIIPMLFNFFRRLGVVKELQSRGLNRTDVVHEMGGREFMYRDMFPAGNRFTFRQLAAIMKNLEDAETQLKSTQRDHLTLLTLICYFICKN